jgi:hypothetical protein
MVVLNNEIETMNPDKTKRWTRVSMVIKNSIERYVTKLNKNCS